MASSATVGALARPPPAPGDPCSRRIAVNASPVQRDSTSDTLAGFMAAAAIFVGAMAVVVRPLPLAVAAIILSLVASAMSGPRSSRLAAWSVGAASLAFVLGMSVAVITDRALY